MKLFARFKKTEKALAANRSTDTVSPPSQTPLPAAPALPSVSIGRATDTGRVRAHNEDSSLTFQADLEADGIHPPFGLFIMADGMGGHQAGEIASSLATRVIANHVLRDIYLPYLMNGSLSAESTVLLEALRGAVEAANIAVHTQVPGSGTTLTCALIIDSRAFLAHVGDSRAYVYNQSQLIQLTHDHSYVDKLVEMGQLTPEAAATHPQRNVLYRAVGQGDQLEIDVLAITLPPESRLLLCCDGLWSMLTDVHLKDILASAPTAQAACDQLVSAANEAGGKDNITAVIVETQRASIA
jgi:serine/threonine protein phosphatase PrpC